MLCGSCGHVIMGDAGKSGFSSIWYGEGYVNLRRALLTGEDLPSYCLECERAPEVDPFIMQMEVAMRQIFFFPFDELREFIKKNKSRYPEYVKEMERIGVKPQRYEEVVIDTPEGAARMHKINAVRMEENMERLREEMYNSWSWKFSAPIRLVGKILLKCRHSVS